MTNYSPLYTSVTFVQSKTGLSNAEVDLSDDNVVRATIEDAESEVELLTGRKFTDANAVTQYFNFNDKDAIGKYTSSVNLAFRPIQSITLCNALDADGNTTDTYDTMTTAEISGGTVDSEDYWLETAQDPLTNSITPYGKLSLKTDTMSQGIHVLKVSYTYGYSTVPIPVRNLATCLAGIRCWIRFIGGSYNRLNSYSIPQQTVDKGDFYKRGQQNIEMLTNEANGLLDRIGRRPRVLVFATGQVR